MRRIFVALGALLALGSACLAGEIAKDAIIQAKANPIWFSDAAQLAHWQDLKRSGDAAKVAAYQQRLRSERAAWQFINQLTVKVIGYDPERKQVSVEALTQGRFAGVKWVLDANSFVP